MATRPEITGRKTQSTVTLMAYSIEQFCQAHGISIDLYFKMQRQGLGPATMKVGSRTLISVEAAAAWRRERESDAKNFTAAE
ncbi:hypothetical protein FBZ94_103743 [Bradyrhizobium sacchari]|uniref:AlpA family transcriptional regulator n=2 Tax=Bradyrhizobium sacchari TaxID=1399419 RepID=A0A560JYD2_9BRAD|nr:hypothetical protein FBZ94_103743 [Bradyrhizobium sacchari]TWB76027.1 hypothetical protein FBZ95_104207 [Bradyrhizobium sacchari]